jgi:phospholipid/cholesterol/gamma-HCH transport system ATP-binding protein
VIRIQNVTKSFRSPGSGVNKVLRGVSFDVPTGCLYGLIGPGASGKSVLLKVIAGLLKSDAGAILVGDQDVTKLSELQLQELRKKLGMLFQNYALFDQLTVKDNIAFPLRRLVGPPEDEVATRVEERLRAVSLPGFGDRQISGLSGGQKKRVGVARATVINAPFVLYDEPAAGLDPVTSQRIFELLRKEQRASGATVIMVSSDLDRMLTVTDRVGMLYRGELIFDGTTEEAKRSKDPRVDQFVHGRTEGPL